MFCNAKNRKEAHNSGTDLSEDLPSCDLLILLERVKTEEKRKERLESSFIHCSKRVSG